MSRAYESGAYAVTTIRCVASNQRIQLSLDGRRGDYAGMPSSRAVQAQVYLPTPPREVSLDGAGPLPRVDSQAALESSPLAWWHDGERFLWLSFPQAQAQVDITIACAF